MKDPKEEARELMVFFLPLVDWQEDIINPINNVAIQNAKKCALNCIEEKKKTLAECLEYGMEYIGRLNHLLEIEEEINKL